MSTKKSSGFRAEGELRRSTNPENVGAPRKSTDPDLDGPPSLTNLPADGAGSDSVNDIFTNLPARRMSSLVPDGKKTSSAKNPRRSSEFESDSFASQSERNLSITESSDFLPKGSMSLSEIDRLGIDRSAPERVRDTYQRVKECLSKQAGDGPSMLDQLKMALRHVLKANTANSYASFEQILSRPTHQAVDRNVGNSRFREARLEEAKQITEILKTEGPIEERVDLHTDEDSGKSKLPNLVRYYPLLRNAGITKLFSSEKASLIDIALKKLLDNDQKVINIKFWGTIYGTKNDYYVAEAEAEPSEEEEAEETEGAETTEEPNPEEEGEEKPEIEGFENLPPLPKPMLKPLPLLVKEEGGTGVNRKAYFVSTRIDGNWTRLPSVTPDQIIIARKLQRGFTGDLSAKVPSFPIFPGNEANYLRAQIARISSATQVSPSGFYMLDSEEEPEEGQAPPFVLTENPEYKPPSVQQLSQPHMKFWAHYGQYILRQGRTFFYDAFEANREEDEEEEEPEEEGEEGEPKPRKAKYPVWYPEKADWYEPEENVPPPLSSVMNDAALDGYPPWSVHFGSKTFPSQSFIAIRSNLWPGAVTVAYNQGRDFFNMYFGRGIKYRSHFVPKLPGHVKHEKYDPTLHEEVDPTPEEEEEIRKAAGGGEGDTEGAEGETEEEEEAE